MNAPDVTKQKFLILTCDSEALHNCRRRPTKSIALFGVGSLNCIEAGISKMMDVADEVGVKMVFFHEVLEKLRFQQRDKRRGGPLYH